MPDLHKKLRLVARFFVCENHFGIQLSVRRSENRTLIFLGFAWFFWKNRQEVRDNEVFSCGFQTTTVLHSHSGLHYNG